MTILGSALGLLVGISLGLLGGGGSVLAVPIFVYVLGLEVKAAVAGSLLVVGLTSLLGVLFHAREGNVDHRTALLFGGVAMAGAYGGARLAEIIPGPVQLTFFALVMLAASAFMIRGRPAVREERHVSLGAVVPAALSVGALTGVVGVGGGFLIVPALVLLLDVPMKRAVGTSLLVIALNAAAGFVGYLGQVAVPWVLLLGFAVFSLLGIFAGERLSRLVPAEGLRRGFGVFLVIVASAILVQNLFHL